MADTDRPAPARRQLAGTAALLLTHHHRLFQKSVYARLQKSLAGGEVMLRRQEGVRGVERRAIKHDVGRCGRRHTEMLSKLGRPIWAQVARRDQLDAD